MAVEKRKRRLLETVERWPGGLYTCRTLSTTTQTGSDGRASVWLATSLERSTLAPDLHNLNAGWRDGRSNVAVGTQCWHKVNSRLECAAYPVENTAFRGRHKKLWINEAASECILARLMSLTRHKSESRVQGK